MTVFALSLAVLCLAAAGLGVGAARGRPLPGGPGCASWAAGRALPRCEACPHRRAEPDGPRGAQR